MSDLSSADQLPRGGAEERRAATAVRWIHLVDVLPTFAIVVVVATAIVLVQNFAINAFFPNLTRLSTDFSAAYLSRELQTIARSPGQTIFLGDSVLWGFRIHPAETAVALLRAQGLHCTNLAFKSGSPPNYYALVRLFKAYGIRPKAVVIEINQKVFNEADTSYRALHPGVEALVGRVLSADDRATLSVRTAPGLAGRFDALIASGSLLYAMRSDIRETLYGDVDATPIQAPRAEMYEGTYDLSPLSVKNVGVRYLDETVELLRSHGVPVLAFLTPTNHVLLHDYIDSPEYRANEAFLKSEVRSRGADVIDLDSAFPASDFLDESHLTVLGQGKLASILRKNIDELLIGAVRPG